MKRWWSGLVAAAALHATAACAQPVTVGASMGMVLPSGRLVSRADYLGAPLLPGPVLGLVMRGAGLGGRPDLAWETALSLGFFQSRTNLDLRTQYLPLDLGLSWEAASLDQLSLRLKCGGGPALVSTNLGATRTVAVGQTYVGGEVQRDLHGLTVAFNLSVGVLWQSVIEDTVRVDIMVMTR